MKFLNIEEQVLKNAKDIQTLKSGIVIDYWCSGLEDLGTLLTARNIGKYAVVSVDTTKHLYLITKRTNEGLIAVDMGIYPAVVSGATGEKGETGETGKDGTGIYGCTATLPPVDSYKEGDFYILYNGDVYKKISNHWIRQTNIKGAQGPVGLNGTVVIPNPVEAYTDELRKIAIDGTVYEIENPYKYLITFDGNGVHFEALEDYKNYIFEWDVEVESTHLLKLDSIEQLTNYQGEPYFTTEEYDAIKFSSQLFAPYNITYARALKDILIPAGKTLNLPSLDQIINSGNGNPLCVIENFKDASGRNRFIEGELNISQYFNGDITYNKWSLSGTVLTIVFAGTLNVGEHSGNICTILSEDIPDWIMDKIIPVSNQYLSFEKIKAYSGYQGVDLDVQVTKESNNLVFGFTYSQNIDVERNFRFQYTLLIDNE